METIRFTASSLPLMCGHSHAVDMLVALVDKARLLSQSRQLF